MSDPHRERLRRLMYPTPEESAADTRDRHQDWIARLSNRDWERIRALGREIQPGYCPARLDDLDARGIAVGVALVDDTWGYGSGERIGTVLGGTIAVLVWVK